MPVLAIFIIILAALAASWFLAPGMWTQILLTTMRRRLGLKAHSIVAGGLRWHYLSGGRGPVLVLLHGFGGDAHNWLNLARSLRHRFTLVIPDLPGFGDSAPPKNLRFDMDSQAVRLEQFVESLDLQPCIFVGNSMGGYIATALAVRRPELIKGLWLLAPLGVRAVEPGKILRQIDLGDLDYLQIRSVTDYRANTIAHMFHRRPWIPGPIVRVLANRARALQDEAPRMLNEARFDSEPLESLAQRVNQPVLLQWGAQDQVTNPAGLEVLNLAFPNAQGELIPDCGHLPMVECTQACERLFRAFYAQHFGN